MNVQVLTDLVYEFYDETSLDMQIIFDTNDKEVLRSTVRTKFDNICESDKTVNKDIFYAFMSPLIRQLFESEFDKRNMFGQFNIRIDLKKTSIKDLTFLYQNF